MGYFEVNKISLRVLTSEGFDTKTGISKQETELLFDTYTMNAPTFFYNQGNYGIEFEVEVLIKQNDFYKGQQVTEQLDTWDKYNTPLTIVTDAFDIPNGKYLLTVKNKRQKRKKYTIWKLRFKQYYENNESFETSGFKVSSLSSMDQKLLQYSKIDETSPEEAIYLLQLKLKQYGCFKNVYTVWEGNYTHPLLDDEGEIVPRVPNGKWDSDMIQDIVGFQMMKGVEKYTGVCDKETITLLVSDKIADEHWWGEMLQ